VVVDDLTRALEQTADSVLITNRDGVIEYVNPAFEVMTGYSREDAIGRTPGLLRSGVQTPRFYATLWNTILSGRPFHSVLTNRTRDGRLFDEEQTITPMRDDSGEITHFVSTGRDVTEFRRVEAVRLHHHLEEEAARVATLMHAEAGQFLASALLSLSDAARSVTPEVRERLDDVRRCLERVEEQFRRVSRGAQPRVVAELGLLEAIRFLVDDCARRTGLEFVVESTLDRQCSALVETQIYKFVQEALSHVTRVTGGVTGTITLAREVRGRRAQDQTVCCSVRGEGTRLTGVLPQSEVLGLRLIQDRLETTGGTLGITATAGGGLELRATVPLEG
jgi:PAS domain S-box-containing protein